MPAQGQDTGTGPLQVADSSKGLGRSREAQGAWGRMRGSAKSHRAGSSKEEEGAVLTSPALSCRPGDREGV